MSTNNQPTDQQLHAAMDAFYPGENWREVLGPALETSLRDMRAALIAAAPSRPDHAGGVEAVAQRAYEAFYANIEVRGWLEIGEEYRQSWRAVAVALTSAQAPDKADEREGMKPLQAFKKWKAEVGYASPSFISFQAGFLAALAHQPTGTEAGRGGMWLVDFLREAFDEGANAASAFDRKPKEKRWSDYANEAFNAFWLEEQDRLAATPAPPTPDSTTQGDGTSQEGTIGPRTITTSRQTCEGCPSLALKDWSFMGENDDLDSGTSAKCSASAGKSITAYWSVLSTTPDWCPALSPVPADREGGR